MLGRGNQRRITTEISKTNNIETALFPVIVREPLLLHASVRNRTVSGIRMSFRRGSRRSRLLRGNCWSFLLHSPREGRRRKIIFLVISRGVLCTASSTEKEKALGHLITPVDTENLPRKKSLSRNFSGVIYLSSPSNWSGPTRPGIIRISLMYD